MSTSFEYLVLLDIEATCWEKRDPQSAEIIGNFEFEIFHHQIDRMKVVQKCYLNFIHLKYDACAIFKSK